MLGMELLIVKNCISTNYPLLVERLSIAGIFGKKKIESKIMENAESSTLKTEE